MTNAEIQLKRMVDAVGKKLNANYKNINKNGTQEFKKNKGKLLCRENEAEKKQTQEKTGKEGLLEKRNMLHMKKKKTNEKKVVEKEEEKEKEEKKGEMPKRMMMKTKKEISKKKGKILELKQNMLKTKKKKITNEKGDVDEKELMPERMMKKTNKTTDKKKKKRNDVDLTNVSNEDEAQNFQNIHIIANDPNNKKNENVNDKEGLQLDVVKAEDETNMPMTFEELNICEEILNCIYELGWNKPTLIQKKVLPFAFQKRDIIGLSETGSGKSACFIIPILQELKEKKKSFFALIVAPTRELCIQISQHFNALGANILIQVVTIFGGVDILSQSLQLAKKPNIIVGTPGRILDHLKNTSGFNLNNLKYLVFDEADKLLSLDFETSINKLLLILPKQRVTFLFSATMTDKVAKLKKASLKNPIKIEASDKYSTSSTLIESFLFVPFKYKYVYLASLCLHFGNTSIIVFANTCSVAQKLTFFCRNMGLNAICLHGKLTQTQRISSLNAFRSKKYNILISTPVGSRGLDLQEIKVVINFDVCSCKEYIHRVGRTARAGRTGKSITIVTQYEVEQFLEMENQMKKKIPKFTDLDPMDVMLNQDKALEAMRLAEIEMKDNQDLYRNKKYKKKHKGRH